MKNLITLEIEYNHNKGHYTSGELSNPDGSVLNLDRLRVPSRESKGMGKLTRHSEERLQRAVWATYYEMPPQFDC